MTTQAKDGDDGATTRGPGDLALAPTVPALGNAAWQTTPGGGRAAVMGTAFAGLIPTSIGEAYELARYLANSKAIPKAYRNKQDDVFTVILAGLEVGLTPIRALNNLTNISGNLGMKADLQLALVRRSQLLDYYDEGFEIRGKTDSDLGTRAEDGAKILALVKAVPDGKPYGWASGRRKGDRTTTTRTFTWIDAETAEIWEREDDDNGGERKKTKLSAKFNYVSFPADMYPKRARGRVLQVTHSDVLAGMLSTEALEGGQVIDATVEPEATVDDMIAETNDEQRDAITAGFDALKLSPARRMQKLVEYRGRPDDLVTWLRDEWGSRAGRGKAGTAKKAKEAAETMVAAAAKAQAPAATEKPETVGDLEKVGSGPTAPAATEPVAKTEQQGPDYPDHKATADFVTATASPDQAEAFVKALDAGPATATSPTVSPAKAAAAKFREKFGSGSPSF